MITLKMEKLREVLGRAYEAGWYGTLDLRDSAIEGLLDECEKANEETAKPSTPSGRVINAPVVPSPSFVAALRETRDRGWTTRSSGNWATLPPQPAETPVRETRQIRPEPTPANIQIDWGSPVGWDMPPVTVGGPEPSEPVPPSDPPPFPLDQFREEYRALYGSGNGGIVDEINAEIIATALTEQARLIGETLGEASDAPF